MAGTTVKPSTIRIINQGLVDRYNVAALFLFQDYGICRELVTGVTLPIPNGTAIDTEGLVFTFSGTQAVNIPFTLPVFSSNIIICGRIKATALQAANPGCAFAVDALSGTQGSLGVGFDNSNPPNVGLTTLTGSAAAIGAHSVGALNTWYTVYAQAWGFGSGGPGFAWINGIPATSGQGGSITGGAGTLNELSIGGQHRAAGFERFFSGNLEWAAILTPPLAPTQPWPDSAAAALYASDFPYNLFSRPKLILKSSGVTSLVPWPVFQQGMV